MKRRLITFLIITLSIVTIVNVSRSLLTTLTKKSGVEERQAALFREKEENDHLKRKLAAVESDAYIEKQAREELGMAKEGEFVVILPASLSAQKQEQTEEDTSQESVSLWSWITGLFQ